MVNLYTLWYITNDRPDFLKKGELVQNIAISGQLCHNVSNMEKDKKIIHIIIDSETSCCIKIGKIEKQNKGASQHEIQDFSDSILKISGEEILLNDNVEREAIEEENTAKERKVVVQTRKKKERFDFSKYDIPVGVNLWWFEDRHIKAKVLPNNKIEFHGKVTTLSASAGILLGLKSVAGTRYWKYGGETLDERRERMDSESEESFGEENMDMNERLEYIDRKPKRKKAFSFLEYNIPIGAKLVWYRNSAIKAKVLRNNKIEFRGEVTSLSAAAKELIGHGESGPRVWMYRGETLLDRRKRMDGERGGSFRKENTSVYEEKVKIYKKPKREGIRSKPTSFVLSGERISVKNWKDILIEICEHLEYRYDFVEKIEKMNEPGRKPFISKNRKNIHSPRELRNRKLFFETSYSKEDVIELSKKILEIFGHNTDLKIEEIDR